MSVPSYNLDFENLRLVVEHVFMPPKLPPTSPDEMTERMINVTLCDSLIEAAQDFLRVISSKRTLWMYMIKMIMSARRAAEAPFKQPDLQRALSDMALGGAH